MTARPNASTRARVHSREVMAYSDDDFLKEVSFAKHGGPDLPCGYMPQPMLRNCFLVAMYEDSAACSGRLTSFFGKHRR